MGTPLARRILISLLAVAALAAGLWLGLNTGDTPPGPGMQATGGPVPSIEGALLPEFVLTDQTGRPFTRTALEGHWSFLFFGYTYCPDICPMTLALLSAVKQEILARGDADRVPQVIFVTVDPERDTISQMARYTEWFDPDFLGLTGSQEQIGQLAAGLHAPFRRVENPQTPDEYLFDHGSGIHLIGPDARLVVTLEAPHEAAAIADGYLKLREGAAP